MDSFFLFGDYRKAIFQSHANFALNRYLNPLWQALSPTNGHLEKRRYLHLHPLIKKHLTVPKGKYLHINRVIKEAQVVFDQ